MKVLCRLDDEEEKVRKALIKYMYLIVFNIMCIYKSGADVETDHVLSEFDDLILASFSVGQWRSVTCDGILLGGIERFVDKSMHTVIYGTGKLGRMTMQYLKDKDLDKKVKCFAVSSKQKDSQLMEKEIVSIDDIDLDDYSVIVASSGKFRREMMAYLKKLKPKESIDLDWYTEKALYRYFSDKNMEI